MRIWIIGILTLGALWCLIQPLFYKRIPRIMLALLLIALLPTVATEILWQRTEAVGTGIVQQVSGKAAGHLHCERFTEALLDLSGRSGEVRLDNPNQAVLTWDTCRDLQAFLLSDKRDPTIKQITAVHVLVHESIHVGGEYNEARTECLAMRQDAKVAHELGASVKVAQLMSQEYTADVYPRLDVNYHTDCSTVA